MTEKSYVWDGASGGDAKYAPYKAETFSELLALIKGDRVLHVNNLLAVSVSAGMVLSVATGVALIAGVYCENSGADTVTIADAHPELPRIDRVIIRIDWSAVTPVTLEVRNGSPSSNPTAPDLVVVPGDVYEFSLARIYVSEGLAAITSSHIIDERVINTHEDYTPFNMMVNSNFVAPAGTGSGGGPAGWAVGGSPTLSQATKFKDIQPSGTTVQMVCAAGTTDYIETILQVSESDSVPLVIKMLVHTIEGELWIDTAGGSATGFRVPQSAEPVEVIIRLSQSANVTLRLLNASATETMTAKVGSITYSYGYVPAELTKIREFVLFGNQIAVTEGGTVSVTSTLNVNIPEFITDDVESIYAQIKGEGDATNGTVNFLAYRDIVSDTAIFNLRLDNQRNDKYLYTQGWLTNQGNILGLDFTIAGGNVTTYSTYLLGIYT